MANNRLKSTAVIAVIVITFIILIAIIVNRNIDYKNKVTELNKSVENIK